MVASDAELALDLEDESTVEERVLGVGSTYTVVVVSDVELGTLMTVEERTLDDGSTYTVVDDRAVGLCEVVPHSM